jgi:hypothetical protein
VAIRSGFWSLAVTLGVDENANLTDATKSAGDALNALIGASKRIDNMCEQIEKALEPYMTLDDLLYELQRNPNFLRETWPNGLPWRKEGMRAYSDHHAHRQGYATVEEAQAAAVDAWRSSGPPPPPPPPPPTATFDDLPPPPPEPRRRRAR